MGKSKPPAPTAEERRLQTSQAELLNLQREQLQQQQYQQERLAPFLYESMGLRPQYAADGSITGYERFETPEQALYREQIEAMRAQQPTQQRLQEQYLTLAEQQARYQAEQAPMQQRLQQQYLTLAEQQAAYQAEQQAWQTELRPELRRQTELQTAMQGQMLEYQQAQLAQEQDRQRLQPLLYEASGVRPIYDESGKITSFALTEEAQARKDYETQLLEHQRKALAGELPVDPTLERALSEGETQLRAQLQAQLGTGYETSTPGLQALEAYRQRAAEARANVAHGQLTSGQQLLQQQAAMNAEQLARSTRGGTGLLGNYGLQPVSFGNAVQAGGMGNALGTYQGLQGNLFAAGSPATMAAGAQGVLGGQAGTLAEYARLAQGFGGAAGSLGQQSARQQQLYNQMQGEYASTLGTAGSILGGAVGGLASWGNPAAISAGMTLGGAAGGMVGRRTY